jgi:hypothetical protein
MKTLNLTASLVAITLALSSAAYADNNSKASNNQHHVARQPYQQVPAKDQSKTENFEGATLIEQDTESAKNNKTLQLHRFDRRPYMEKSKD